MLNELAYRYKLQSIGLLASAFILCLTASTFAADEISYSREIRPILSANCFKCHGPDEGNRESSLRLDERDAAIGKADGEVQIIIPGKPDESELIKRLIATDQEKVMPPPATKKHLTEKQVETLKKWIAQGAKYEEHWAFVAPKQSPLPKVKKADWPRNPIDNFILSKMEAAGLEPSAPASRYALIRRVYLDLIGIPPTTEEADAFVNDRSPDAYEKRVDSLLKSPQYGERWARRWLDLARYSDTNGYEKDRTRSIWPYRDWVINALNADMPYDQFTIEQIAGDMLPNATVQQKVATGFHRNTMLNEEGGIDPLEFRFYSSVDRINTTSTVWLGLTLGCAQCHTHKYDPIKHTEYYEMMSWLDNADEPEFDVPTDELKSRRKKLESQIAKLEDSLEDRYPVAAAKDDDKNGQKKISLAKRHKAADEAFSKWLETKQKEAVKWQILRPTSLTSNVAKLNLLDDGSILATGDQTKRDVYDLVLPIDLEKVTALRLEPLQHESLPDNGPGRIYYEGKRGGFLLNEFTATIGNDNKKIIFKNATESNFQGNPTTESGRAIDSDPLTSWVYNDDSPITRSAVFPLAEQLEMKAAPEKTVQAGGAADQDAKPVSPRELKLSLVSELYYSVSLGRFRIWATDAEGDIKANSVPTDIEQLCLINTEDLKSEERAQLRKYFLSTTPELAEARKEIDKLRGEIPRYTTTLVMQERPTDNPRKTFRHDRGEFLSTKEEVHPNALGVLHKVPAEAPKNRLTFARWLVDEKNPLVGRVTMNQHWSAIFGRGIVRTTQDFGFQGELPTHPELLDWLAVEFIKQRWSLKAMHRLIVTSATYQQSSAISDQLRERDPENLLLARAPRVRLEAELVRDQILAVSGLLSKKLGGQSVFPPQPKAAGVDDSYRKVAWVVSTGEDRYRRGLYTFSKRTSPFAMTATFDAPSGESCVARRDLSNTPLQALTLLNDDAFVEASQKLGNQIAALSSPVEDRMLILFRRCLIRSPQEHELKMLVKYYNGQLERVGNDSAKAEAIAGPGNGSAQERAAWTLTARTLLNLDELITKE